MLRRLLIRYKTDIIILTGLLFLAIILFALAGGDLHDYPCGIHISNGYFRECK